MKETIRVHFCDFWPEWNDEDFITPILEEKYDLIIDNKKPDVVFYSIFGNSHSKYNCKKILYVAENIRAPYNESAKSNIKLALEEADYTISFDPPTETNYRLPLWQAFILNKPEYWDKLINKVKHENFKRFCSFTVSNEFNFIRNNAYVQLSNYKRIHSYGRYMLNDFSLQKLSKGKYWRDAKDDFFSNKTHKFSLAFENNIHPWYCTEKLMDAFLVGSLPIYWGDPKVGKDWNKKAFIDTTRDMNWLEKVKELDTNQTLWNDYYGEPVFTIEQKEKHELNMKEFKNWLIYKINK